MKNLSRVMMSVMIFATTPAAFAGKYHEHRRIQNGVKSGELTKQEAQNLRTQKRDIHNEAKAMRDANGGKLTKEERQAVQGQRKELSKETYQMKHNDDVRPNSPAAGQGTSATAPVAPVAPATTGTN